MLRYAVTNTNRQYLFLYMYTCALAFVAYKYFDLKYLQLLFIYKLKYNTAINYIQIVTSYMNSYYAAIILPTLVFVSFFFYTLFIYILENIIYIHLGFSFLPKKYKLFTILRAPHNYGGSKEHFHLLYYKSSFYYPIILSITNTMFIKELFVTQGNSGVLLNSAVWIA